MQKPLISETGRRIWKLLNTAFGLWLLSTVAVGGGVWLFQSWRDAVQARSAENVRYDDLSLEAAGRTSQFLAWLAANLAHEAANGDHEFREGVTPERIVQAIQTFGDAPRRRRGANVPYIQEVLEAFSTRNLLSVYAELDRINRGRMEALDPAGEFSGDAPQPIRERPNFRDWDRLRAQSSAFSLAMLALLEPNWLLAYKPIDYRAFRDRFSEAFLSPAITRHILPYTDCFDC